MNSLEQIQEKAAEIEEKIGYSFTNKELLVLAFVHRSYYNEHRQKLKEHNERMEFLGDAVLGMIVSEYLFSYLPKESEGQLSHFKAHLVEAGMCSMFVQQLSITDYLLLGKGERMNDGRGRETIFADLFEALLAAIYLDGGIEKVRTFFWRNFEEKVQSYLKQPQRNYKAELQDWCQKKYQHPPSYRVIAELGPDHNKSFEVAALIGDKQVGVGSGPSKKEAEQKAACDAMTALQKEAGGDDVKD